MEPEEESQIIDPIIDPISLNFIVSQSLYLLEIDPLEGPQKAGYTEREFAMYVLSGIHQGAGEHQMAKLDQKLLDNIKEQLGIIAERGLMGNAVRDIQMKAPRNKRYKEDI